MSKRMLFSNIVFFVVLAAGAACGYGIGNLSQTSAVIAGVFICLVSMFVGMILAYMDDREHKKSTDKHNKERAARAANTMANRVANRLLARYVSGLDNDTFRANVFKCVNDTILDEIETMKARYDEKDKVGK